jgi:sigma-B regulation protein RsbU (phosphoserine phosphatase)
MPEQHDKVPGFQPGLMPATELAMLAEIGSAIAQAQLDEDQLCKLVYDLTGRITPTDTFQIGLFEGDHYRIKVWIKNGARQPEATFPVFESEGIIGWLRTGKQPLLVRDFLTDEASLPARPVYFSDRPPRSAIFLPMLVADTVIGTISVQDDQPNAFDEAHVHLLTLLANQSAAALNNARLYARSQRRLNDLTTVSEIGRELTRILDLDQLLSQVAELIRSRFGYYHAQIFLVARDNDFADFEASSGRQLQEKGQSDDRSARVGQKGIIGWVAQHGQPVLANDLSAKPRDVRGDPRLLPDTRAELAVPLITKGEVLGVLDVQSAETGAFTQDDLFVLQTLADQVGVAINLARAHKAQQEEAWITTVMLEMAETISGADGVQDVLDAAVRVTAMLAGVESCTVWLWDEEPEAFRYGAGFGFRFDDSLDPHTSLCFSAGEWPTLDRLRTSSGKVPAVIRADDPQVPDSLRRIFPGETIALVPMLNKGQVFGALGVSFGRGSGASPLSHGGMSDERRLAMLSGIARQVATAVDNSRLAAAREEEAWISTVLLQVSEAIRRLQPVDLTLAQVARLTPDLTGVDRCAVLLRSDDGYYRVRTVHAVHPELMEPYANFVVSPGDLPLLDDACRLGQPLVVDDVHANPRVPKAWRERFGSCTLLVMPLLVADEAIGVLLADDVETTHTFNPRRVRILSGIADQTALAIENARLQAQEAERARLARELELAQDIQRSLLPNEAPRLPGYQIAYWWQSAREVSGDFCDFIGLGSRGMGLLIADVSGKGIPAALYMMFARTLLRAAALGGREPADALRRANELMVTNSTSDMFVTVYYSTLDAQTHTLSYASAGHNLALHISTDSGVSQPLMTAGIPLGIIAAAEIGQKSLHLNPGDVVLFYSDGVTEALNPAGEEFGETRLAETVRAHCREPAAAIAEAIAYSVQKFVGDQAQYDDCTLILLQRDLQ